MSCFSLFDAAFRPPFDSRLRDSASEPHRSEALPAPPSWTIRPFSITAQRLAVLSAKSMFCSTSRTASPVSRRCRRSALRCRARRSAGCPPRARRAARPWPRRERARDRQLLLLAARQRAAGLAEPVAQDGKCANISSSGTAPRPLGSAPAGDEVFAHAELGEDAAPLRHIARRPCGRSHASAGRRSRRRRADPAGERRQQAGQRAQQRRLADAVAAEQRQHFALGDDRLTPFSTGTEP